MFLILAIYATLSTTLGGFKGLVDLTRKGYRDHRAHDGCWFFGYMITLLVFVTITRGAVVATIWILYANIGD
jgi:hypothetical protein